MNQFIANDYNTSPKQCEFCGEFQNYVMYEILDGFDNVPNSIEELCETCIADYIRAYGK